MRKVRWNDGLARPHIARDTSNLQTLHAAKDHSFSKVKGKLCSTFGRREEVPREDRVMATDNLLLAFVRLLDFLDLKDGLPLQGDSLETSRANDSVPTEFFLFGCDRRRNFPLQEAAKENVSGSDKLFARVERSGNLELPTIERRTFQWIVYAANGKETGEFARAIRSEFKMAQMLRVGRL